MSISLFAAEHIRICRMWLYSKASKFVGVEMLLVVSIGGEALSTLWERRKWPTGWWPRAGRELRGAVERRHCDIEQRVIEITLVLCSHSVE